MAPEETRTRSAPLRRTPARLSTRRRTRSGSMPPAAVVSEDDPTLTTTRWAPETAARVILRRPPGRRVVEVEVGQPVLLVVATRDVGAGLALAPVRHRGVDRPAAVRGRARLVEPLVLASATQHLGAGVDARLEVEDDGVVRVADEHRVTLDRAELDELLLHAEPVQAVGEEPHGLVVAEVGLPDPALGLLAAHAPALALARLGDGELRPAAGRRRPDHDARRLHLGLLGTPGSDDGGHREHQLAQPLVAGGADRDHRPAALGDVLGDDVGHVPAVGDVDLVEGDETGAVLESAVLLQLLLDHLEVADRVAARLHGGEVDDVDDGRAALDVAQEVVPEAAALARALDQPGYVGDGEGRVTGQHDAEVGHQRGERVVGDLRPRPRQRRDQAGLAGAGKADQPDVGDDLELEARPSGRRRARRAGRSRAPCAWRRPAPRCRGRHDRPGRPSSRCRHRPGRRAPARSRR